MPRIDGKLSEEELGQVVGGSKTTSVFMTKLHHLIQEEVAIKIPTLLKPREELNPQLWDENKKLKSEIRDRLIEIAEKFIKPTLGSDAEIKDITFTGSLANYNYTDLSDIDLHILIDFKEVNSNEELVRGYFNAVKSLWNSMHDIKIKGFEVEVYVQDDKEPHTSSGVYSLMNDKWIKEPSRTEKDVDEDSIMIKAESLMAQIDEAVKMSKSGDHEGAYERSLLLRDKLRRLRKSGLEKNGEYSVENLAFKTLRNTGYLAKLSNLKKEAYDAMYSLGEVHSDKQRKYMCAMAKPNADRPESLSQAQAQEMCTGPMKSEAKKKKKKKKSGGDRCTRIAKRKYDVWPSAYASGAVVKCRQGKIWKGVNEATDESKEKDSGLHGWFSRQGGKGKSKGWVDCNTCRKDKKTGKKTCKSCGRKEGEKRAKYPSCRPTPSACGTKGKGKKWGKKSEDMEVKLTLELLKKFISEELQSTLLEQEYYEVDALSENEEYCPVCVSLEEKKKKACKPSKGKRFAKRVDGKCRSFGQSGQAKSGGDRIRPGTKKGDAYCARSAGIKKCKNPPCANTLSRKKWKCRGKKSVAESGNYLT